MSEDIQMQTRCVWCLREQYALAVWHLSHGEAGCTWCGHVPPIFTSLAEYRAALNARRRQLHAQGKVP